MAAPLLLACLAGCGSGQPEDRGVSARPVKMFAVESPSAVAARSFPAVTRAAERTDLSFRVAGTVQALEAVEGEAYEAGTVLARLDPRDFESRVAQARSALDAAEADLALLKAGTRDEDVAQLEAQLAAAQARQERAQAELGRYRELFDRGLVARSEFETADTAAKVAARESEAAAQQVSKARTGARPQEVQAAESRTESTAIKLREAEAALDDTYLRAPFDGQVATVSVERFQEVQAKQTVLSFQATGGLELEVQVPESLVLLSRSDRELSFEVRLAGDPSKTYPAEFREFSAEADPVTQTYRLTLGMAPPSDVNVFPGMTAEVTVSGTRTAGDLGPLLIPAAALGATADGSPIAWVIDPDSMRVRPVPVRTGAPSGERIEILEGLKPGDTIAAAGVSQLREGMVVRPLDS